LPLHHTQEILVDNDDELKIKLKLCLTHDFLMELLSFGDNLIVIEPKTLVMQIKEAHKNAYKQY
jgi:predicted DNA-binding transcriptional regulator YafY